MEINGMTGVICNMKAPCHLAKSSSDIDVPSCSLIPIFTLDIPSTETDL